MTVAAVINAVINAYRKEACPPCPISARANLRARQKFPIRGPAIEMLSGNSDHHVLMQSYRST